MASDRQEAVQDFSLQAAKDYWSALQDKRSHLSISHDVYLKLWQLNQPSIRDVGAMLFDECQDASASMLRIVAQQTQLRQIYVGDPHQQIYAWRGAVNAMPRIAGETYYLTQSFRFGPAIAGLANALLALKQETQTLKGYNAIPSPLRSIQGRATYLCRTHAALLEQAILKTKQRQTIAVIGGIAKPLEALSSAYALYNNHYEAVTYPSLKMFNTWWELHQTVQLTNDPELRLLESLVEKYTQAIPTLCRQIRDYTVPETIGIYTSL